MGDNNKQNGVVYLTRERLVELEKELHELRLNGRAEMAAKISEARGHGDLTENAEYDAAKEELPICFASRSWSKRSPARGSWTAKSCRTIRCTFFLPSR